MGYFKQFTKWFGRLSPLEKGAVAAAAGLGAFGFGKLAARKAFGKTAQSFTRIITSDPYDENLWEFFSAAKRVSPQEIIETNLRAAEGRLINRPLGSPLSFPHFESIMFDMAQLHRLPTTGEVPVSTEVVLGPKAARPLVIKNPLMVSGMAYGIAMHRKVKIAMARGATIGETAISTGEGPYLPEERKAASKLIIQYDRGGFKNTAEILKKADMVEVQFGQGALGGTTHYTDYSLVSREVRRRIGLKKNEPIVIRARHLGIETPKDLSRLVRWIREVTGGVPISVKIGAGNHLEEDLAFALEAGVDVVTIDGAQAATAGSAPILQDHFGVPTLFALLRANRYLSESRARGDVSLIIAGGLRNPGDYLKCLALGADAVYIGTMALFAVSHGQTHKAIPYEPPTQVVWSTGKFAGSFDVKKGAESLGRYLLSCREEIQEGVRALGKTSLREVGREDLFAIDPQTAWITGLPFGARPRP